MTTMAGYWAATGRRVTVVTLYPESHDFFPLDSGVRRVVLDLGADATTFRQAILNNIRRIWRLRTVIQRTAPDVVISFMTAVNLLTLLASTGLRVPVIVSERTDPLRHSIGRVWSGLRRILYPRASAVVVQSEAIRNWASGFVPQGRVAVIPNPVGSMRPVSEERIPAPLAGLVGVPLERTIVSVGRLSPEKGLDLLIRAFAKLQPEHLGWSLLIIGEGGQRQALESLAVRLGVRHAVQLPGRVQNLESVLAKAALFVLSSRYEGFPNALLEAMSCGAPVIATDCPSGPRQIIRHGVDGLLVPPEDVDALADAMRELIRSPGERARLATRAVEVRERFAVERVMGMWDELLEAVTSARRG